MVNISEEKWIEMLEKKADGSYIAKYPKVKSKSGITFDEHLAESTQQAHLPKNVGLANVDNIKQMPISGGVLENYSEKLTEIYGATVEINLDDGNVFYHYATHGNATYTITNAKVQAHSFTLIVRQPLTSVTLTFPASVKWQGGEIPDMTTVAKTYVLTFMTIDGGSTWLGMFGGEF